MSSFSRRNFKFPPWRVDCFACAFLLAIMARAADSPGTEPATREYETRTIEKWTVHIRTDLRGELGGATDRAIELLRVQLSRVSKIVPGPALARLQSVQLWLTPPVPGAAQTAEYHPDVDWLREHGRDPAMAKGIQFSNIPIFEKECKRMPLLALHELAHAYHDQVLGFDNPEILAAYQRAADSKSYDAVRRWDGKIVRAYAMTNAKEYFAESSEAYFGANDFFPSNREELVRHDPRMAELLEKVWNRR